MCSSICYIPLTAFDLLFGINFLRNGRIVSFAINWKMYLLTPIDYILQTLCREGNRIVLLVLFSLLLPSFLEKRRINTFDFILSFLLLIELKLEIYIPTWFNYILVAIARLWIIYRLIYNEASSRNTWVYGITTT